MGQPEEAMKILALDLGLKTGFSISIPGTFAGGPPRVESGTFEVPSPRGESRGMRFIRWGAWLREMLEMTKPELVVYEQPHARGGAATDILVGMGTRVQEYCAGRGIEYAMVHAATVKKWSTGSGASKKPAMQAEAERRAGRRFDSEDEADAFLLMLYAIELYGAERAPK
jgi:Holliday junction resolvasome RuvABC endonuclease subunit